jgi:lipoyl synthase
MVEWLEALRDTEILQDAGWDEALVSEFSSGRAGARRPIRFFIPGFKAYASSELRGSPPHVWPAVSITGNECKLQCDHCRAEILRPMLPATTPEALWQVASRHIAAGASGMLLSGGSNRRNEVEYGAFLPTIRRIKDAFPDFRIAIHTALVDEAMARDMEAAGIDVAMLDVIGARETLKRVYHLKRTVDDFERALASLVATRMRVVPHIVLGLHYGRFLGEWQALEIVRRNLPDALVLVVAMPYYAAPTRPFALPDPHQAGRFFMEARLSLPAIPVQLGCARPAGSSKPLLDGYAIMSGLDGIAHPAEGMVELAVRLGRNVSVSPTCCSISTGEFAYMSDTTPEQGQIEPSQVQPRSRLAGIPVVAA